MNIKSKLYWRSFFIFGITYGIIMSGIEYLEKGSVDFWKQFFQAGFFAGMTSWILTSLQYRSIKKQGKENDSEEDFKVSQSELLNVNIPIQNVYEILKNHELLKSWKIKFENHQLSVRTKVTWKSWGEKIKICMNNDKIMIESKPALRTTLFDYGKNKENVELIKNILQEK